MTLSRKASPSDPLDWYLGQSVEYDGRDVRFDVIGNGPSVVVAHGTPWSSFNMRHLIRGLSKDFTVYYYDMLGYGQSGMAPGDVSLGIQNTVLNFLLDHWGLDCPAIVGHDFGGATVLRTHLIDECDFRKIVLIDPVAVSPWGSPFFRHVKKYEAAFAGVPDYIHEAMVRAYVATAAYQPIDPDTLDRIVAPWLGDAGRPAFYRQIAQADAAFTDAVEPMYGDIAVPVLVLWGREDEWIPLEKGEALRRMIPGSILRTIADTGHLVIEEQPEALISEIQRFLMASSG